VAMLVALVVGSVVLVPALIYLYVLFQRAHPEHPGSAPSRSTAVLRGGRGG
jgi:cytochrome d ubiquinol oxidase subunit II